MYNAIPLSKEQTNGIMYGVGDPERAAIRLLCAKAGITDDDIRAELEK